MGREHRIISGPADVGGAGRPGARAVLRRPRVNDAPFYVMGFVDGHVIRDRAAAEAVAHAGGPPRRQRVARRHDGGDPRRRPRRRAVWPTSAATRATSPASSSAGTASGTQQKTRELAGDRPCARRPARAAFPSKVRATIVHGDYRLDNCMVGDDGAGRGRARLGDLHARRSAGRRRPAAGVLDRPGRRRPRPGAGRRPPAPGFCDRADLAERYAAVSGRDVVAASTSTSRSRTGSWPASCEGVYSRYLGGALGSRDPAELEPFKSCRSTAPQPRQPNAWRRCHERSHVRDCTSRCRRLDATPVLVVMLTGWIDASGAAAAAMATVQEECDRATAGHVRRRHVHRLPRPPTDDGAARGRQRPPRVVRHRTARRARQRRPRRADAQRPRTRIAWRPLRRRRRRRWRSSSVSAGWSPSARTRSPRRTPETPRPVEQLAVDRGRRQRRRS